jgi:hypothetical protein
MEPSVVSKFVAIVAIFSFSFFSNLTLAKSTTHSKRVEDYFEILRHDNTNFEPDGAVCERVAVREIEPMYPAEHFEIINSIQYDDQKSTIGELDIVVINKFSGMVEAVAEVKCWKSFQGGLKKAKNQRMRFQNYLNRNIVLTDSDGKKYPKAIFENIQKYFTISGLGGLTMGFDFEMSLTLKEFIELRGMLLDCQAQSRCPASIH